jgi:hypothetical protein
VGIDWFSRSYLERTEHVGRHLDGRQVIEVIDKTEMLRAVTVRFQCFLFTNGQSILRPLRPGADAALLAYLHIGLC